MAKSMERLRLQGKFVDLSPSLVQIVDPAKPVDVKVAMRLPLAFVGKPALNELSADPNQSVAMSLDPNRAQNQDKYRIPHDRVQPPGVDIPGYQLTYEQLVASDAGQRIMSLYFGVSPADPNLLDKIPGEIKSKLKLATDVFWKNETIPRPDGTTAAWKTISVEAPQGFYGENQGFVTPDQLNGTFVLWVHEAQGHYIFAAYRFPTSSFSMAPVAKGLPDAFRSAAGTLQVTAAGPMNASQPPAAAKP